jgi:hypothetical protein
VINARIRGAALPNHPSASISATGGWESDRAFATTDALGTRRSLSKRDAQRVKRAGISIVASTLRRHTLLVAAILAPLRRFDT